MFQRILVPVDLTKKSLGAVDVAYEFAKRFGARVTLIHVIETIEHIAFDEMKDFYDRLEKSATDVLQKFAEKFVADGMEVAREVLYGHRSEMILEYAIVNRVDLIVMASHRVDPDPPGHDWSSLSYAVAILSPCPVMLVK